MVASLVKKALSVFTALFTVGMLASSVSMAMNETGTVPAGTADLQEATTSSEYRHSQSTMIELTISG